MPLWNNVDHNPDKPKWLTEEEKNRCFATNEGWVLRHYKNANKDTSRYWDEPLVTINKISEVHWIRSIKETEERYNWKGHEVKLDSTGNIYALLQSNDAVNFDDNRFDLIKYNNSGEFVWKKRITDPTPNTTDFTDYLESNSITLDNYDNPIISFYATDEVDFITNQIHVIKFSSGGNVIWKKRLDSPINFAAASWSGLSVDSSNNIYLCGEFSYEWVDSESLLVKLNENGDIIWKKTFNGSLSGANSYFNSLTISPSNNIYISFDSNNNTGDISRDTGIVKINSSGDILWQKIIRGFGTEWPGASIVLDSSENVYFCFRDVVLNSPGNRSGVGLAKFTSNGDLVYNKHITDPNISLRYAFMEIDNSDNLYITYTNGSWPGQNSYYMKINSLDTTPNIVWNLKLSKANSNYAIPQGLAIDSESLYSVLKCYNENIGPNGENSGTVLKMPINATGIGTFGDYTISTETGHSISDNIEAPTIVETSSLEISTLSNSITGISDSVISIIEPGDYTTNYILIQ